MSKYKISNIKDMYGKPTELFIEDGKFVQSCTEFELIDGKGLTALPGLVDMQVHLRVPGGEYKEDIETGTMAAAHGGFTHVACMPNTNPCLDNMGVINDLRTKLSESAKCQVYIIPAMTKNIAGEEICDFESYKENGILAITDDGRGIQDDAVMKEVFTRAAKVGLPIMQHCEVESISHGAPLHLGKKSQAVNIEGQSGLAESEMIRRDIDQLRETGGHYHVLHMSAKESVAHVKAAKKEGLKVTCEVTPHHLLLCDEDIPELNTNYKMNPPLRSKEDRAALNDALLDGTIDFITTDHAPHSPEEKEQAIEQAPFGIIGLETSFPLMYSKYVATKKMTLERLVQLMSWNPAQLFGFETNTFEVGKSAHLTLVDLTSTQKVAVEKFYSKSSNSPFIGWELMGWPAMTIFKGSITYNNLKGNEA